MILKKLRFYFNSSKIIENAITGNNGCQGKGAYLQNRLHFVKTSSPRYLGERLKMFNLIKDQNNKLLQKAEKRQITITLRDGSRVSGTAFETTPSNLLKNLPREVSESALVARVKYLNRYQSPLSKGVICIQTQQNKVQSQDSQIIIDLSRPLEGDCTIQFINFQDKVGKEVFWHSSSHLLGQSLQQLFGVWLCHGPSTTDGFFYDSYIGDYRISQGDFEGLQKQIKLYSKQKQIFERILLSKQQALELFSYNPFKVQLINSKIPTGGITSAYRCGNNIDLCTGPHIPSADKVRGFKVTKNSSAYWLGDKQREGLQRVYGVSFPRQSQLEQYVKMQQELAKKDHRYIGVQQELFNFSNLSAGSALFLPHGTVIYNRLIELMRSEYNIRGYKEVISPNIYHSELWKMSGHYFKYKENIFFVKEESGEEHGLKPMNCPGHCLMFDLMQKSYKDLPIRMADFGVLHRNQISGALTGLTRVRRFQQDDAHIFCMFEQIESEILGVLDLLDYVYSIFGFKYVLELSTRPTKFLGTIEEWDKAEQQLKDALKAFAREYKLNQGDGAFYGPKIDVKLFDVFGREHQCGTIQLDFQLPLRFDLQFRTKQNDEIKVKNQQFVSSECSHNHQKPINDKQLTQEQKYNKIGNLKQGFARPVIIHRAIFGSLQRFIAILCEHTGGKWDFWISPRQIKLVTVNSQSIQFADKVYNTLLLKGFSVQIDKKGDSLNKKIRKAQLQGFNYIGVIGKEQASSETVNLRRRDQSKQLGRMSIDSILGLFASLSPGKSRKRIEVEKGSFDVRL